MEETPSTTDVLKRHLGSPKQVPSKKRLELGLKISEADHIQSQLLELLHDSVSPITPTEFVRTCGEVTTNVLSTSLESRDNQANLVRTDLQETQTPLANQPLLFKTGTPLTPKELYCILL